MEQLGKSYRLIGKLHAPLGEVIQVEGIVVEGDDKGYEDGPNLRVQRIQGRVVRQDIQIKLHPYFIEWGKTAELPKLEFGKTYQMEGYETGGYIGIPRKAYKNAGISLQTSDHYFRTQFVAYKAKLIAPLRFKPADSQGRPALKQDAAKTQDHQSIIKKDE